MPSLSREAKPGHHGAGDLGHLLDVSGGARRHLVLAEHQFLGDATAHRHRQHGDELFEALRDLIALGQRLHHAKRAAARNDGRLVNGRRGRHRHRDERVAGFVIGGQPLFLFGHDEGAPFGAHHDLVARILEFLTRDDALSAPRRKQRRLVDQVHEIRAREARRSARHDLEVDVGPERDLARHEPSGSSRGR